MLFVPVIDLSHLAVGMRVTNHGYPLMARCNVTTRRCSMGLDQHVLMYALRHAAVLESVR